MQPPHAYHPVDRRRPPRLTDRRHHRPCREAGPCGRQRSRVHQWELAHRAQRDPPRRQVLTRRILRLLDPGLDVRPLYATSLLRRWAALHARPKTARECRLCPVGHANGAGIALTDTTEIV